MAATKSVLFSQRDTTGFSADFVWTGRDIGAGLGVAAVFCGNGITTNQITSITSPNLTWTVRIRAVDSGNNNRVEIWTAFNSGGALTAEVLTQDDAPSASYGLRSFVLVTIAGTDAAGMAGATASDVDSSPADPTLSITATATGSYLLAGLVGRGTGDTTEDGNTTQEYSSGSWAGFAFGERVWSRASTGAGAHTLGSTGDDPLFWIMGGLEIMAAATGGSTTRGMPFASDSTAFNGGRTFRGPLHAKETALWQEAERLDRRNRLLRAA